MKFLSFSAFLFAGAVGVGAQQATVATPTVNDDNEITLTGCVIKGDGGYVLSTDQQLNITSTTTAVGTTGTPVVPTGAAAPAATPALPGTRVFYWLDDDDDLEEHAGHRVEVKGKLEGDIDRGEIEAEIENGMVELEFKVDNRKVTIKVPHAAPAATSAVGTSGTAIEDKPKDIPFSVRKVDVKSIKMLASTCTPVQ